MYIASILSLLNGQLVSAFLCKILQFYAFLANAKSQKRLVYSRIPFLMAF